MKDDKIRMRCTGCGKRVKFPANMRGVTFRCPKCHTVLVTPLTLEEMDSEKPVSAPEAASAALKPRRAPGPPRPPKPREEQPAPVAEAPRKPRTPSWHRLHVFLVREQQRLCERAARVLANPDMDDKQKRDELISIRRERAVATREFSDRLLADLERELAELRNSPRGETDSGKREIALIERERNALTLFLDVMFRRRTVAEDEEHRGPTPGTPGVAGEPPSRPASPGPRTPEN